MAKDQDFAWRRDDELADSDEDTTRLKSAKQYLENLHKYIERIELNLATGNRYEENMMIWENDVQIVTALLQETINEYIYYENKQIQSEQAANRQLYLYICKWWRLS